MFTDLDFGLHSGVNPNNANAALFTHPIDMQAHVVFAWMNDISQEATGPSSSQSPSAPPRSPGLHRGHLEHPVLPRVDRASASSYSDALAEPEEAYHAQSVLSVDADSRKSQRSTSPIKRAAALRDVAGGIFYQKLSDDGNEIGAECDTLFSALRDFEDSIGIIPSGLYNSETLQRRLGKALGRPHHKCETDRRPLQDLEYELYQVLDIVEDSQQCSSQGESEAHWNAVVHAPLLRLALGRDKRVGYKYVPGDKIDHRWLPPHSSGFATGSRIVDFVIYLNEDNDEVMQAALAMLTPDVLCSVNHINPISLQRYPIAINIETKTISRTEEEARIQLAIWVASQVRRIQALIDDSASKATVLGNMIFPLVFVDADEWTVMFARPMASAPAPVLGPLRPRDLDKLEIYTKISLGSTETIIGTYRLLASLRALRDWADITFRGWWKELLAP
ncbi:hypothetical protein GGS24DRAFT_486286 [Hypoxylon argillaceum]|nr:hypothetical protein GGS24DRAFT_486286 [Hypoxylon argillaceum]